MLNLVRDVSSVDASQIDEVVVEWIIGIRLSREIMEAPKLIMNGPGMAQQSDPCVAVPFADIVDKVVGLSE